MTPGVVHAFETVEVQDHHGKAAPGVARARRDPVQMGQRIAAIVQSGQRVSDCQPQAMADRSSQRIGAALAVDVQADAQRGFLRVQRQGQQIAGADVQRHRGGFGFGLVQGQGDGRMPAGRARPQIGHQPLARTMRAKVRGDHVIIRGRPLGHFGQRGGGAEDLHARRQIGGQRRAPTDGDGRVRRHQPDAAGHGIDGLRFGHVHLAPGFGPKAQLGLGLARAHQAADARQQDHLVQRLCQEFICPRLQRVQAAGAVARGGDDHHRDVLRRRVGAQAAADIQPRDIGQHHVQKDHLRLLAARKLQRLGARGRLDRFVTGGVQLDLQDDPVRRQIVHD